MDGSRDLPVKHHSLECPQTQLTDKTLEVFQRLTTTHFHISCFPLPPLFRNTYAAAIRGRLDNRVVGRTDNRIVTNLEHCVVGWHFPSIAVIVE